jgi:hypothetical protein
MEGGASKESGKNFKRDRVTAMTFAKVATEYRVKLIIYLGGLIHAEEEEDDDDGKLSQHICEVERRWRNTTTKTTFPLKGYNISCGFLIRNSKDEITNCTSRIVYL